MDLVYVSFRSILNMCIIMIRLHKQLLIQYLIQHVEMCHTALKLMVYFFPGRSPQMASLTLDWFQYSHKLLLNNAETSKRSLSNWVNRTLVNSNFQLDVGSFTLNFTIVTLKFKIKIAISKEKFRFLKFPSDQFFGIRYK